MSRILLVRHGQASWGAEDYDRLSDHGVEQSRVLGSWLADRGIVPDLLLSGAMVRHADTLAAAADAAGWDLPVTVDPGWDEFDHVHVLAQHPTPDGVDVMTDHASFQSWFEGATERWTGGEHDDYHESFTDFGARVVAALERVPLDIPSGATALVSTSGGPLAWAASSAIGGDAATWRALNRVTVNSGVTTFAHGRRGLSLLSFNEHSHLSPDQITYR